jgi:hypothetical protein
MVVAAIPVFRRIAVMAYRIKILLCFRAFRCPKRYFGLLKDKANNQAFLLYNHFNPVGQEQSMEISKEVGKLTEHHSGIQDRQGFDGSSDRIKANLFPSNLSLPKISSGLQPLNLWNRADSLTIYAEHPDFVIIRPSCQLSISPRAPN